MSWSIPGYSATRPLGPGAAVWAGQEEATGDPVALRRVAVATSSGIAWLAAEGERVTRFRHPNVLPVRAVLSSGSELVLVSHLAERSFATVRGAGRLRSGQVVAVFAPLAHALAAAHDAGLGHGAIGPGSVVFSASGDPLLAGVGVARLAAGPEEQPNPAADVYALAVVAARTLTGHPLPESGDGVQRWADHAHTLGVPALVAVAICSALSPVPRHRPTAEAFAELLYAGVAPEPVEFPGVPEVRDARGRPAAGADVEGQGAPSGGLRSLGCVVQAGGERAARALAGLRLSGGASPERVVATGPMTAAAAAGGAAPGTRASTSAERWAAVRSGARSRGGKVRAVVVAIALLVVAGAGVLWIRQDAESRPSAVSPGDPAPNWPAVVDQLDENRAVAFSRADPVLLRTVYAAGSAPLAADARAIGGLLAEGAHAEGVRHDVRRVQAVALSDATAELEVTSRMRAYRVLGHTGGVLRAAPTRPDRRFRISLVPAARGWLISAVSSTEAMP